MVIVALVSVQDESVAPMAVVAHVALANTLLASATYALGKFSL